MTHAPGVSDLGRQAVKSLKELDVYENTVILFLSDNGGDAGGGVTGSNTGKGTCGTAQSHAKYGQCWANACDTPFRKYKAWLHEGGVATPLIAHWPRGIPSGLHGTLVTEPTHTIDLMATCVDLSGGKYPETYKGNQVIPMAGKTAVRTRSISIWVATAPCGKADGNSFP